MQNSNSKTLPFQVKVCGMRDTNNIESLTQLSIQYIGFIFYEKSKRNVVSDTLPKVPSPIQKVGVFVDVPLDEVVQKLKHYDLQVAQLHGQESVSYCQELKKALPHIIIWKVKGVKDTFDTSVLEPYETSVDAFLFDTKGKEKGGNGYCFDWNVLKGYDLKTPFILSGGIGLDQVEALQEFMKHPISKHLIAIDVNSKFETAPAQKDTTKIALFLERLTNASS